MKALISLGRGTFNVEFVVSQYQNKGTSVVGFVVETGEPFCTLSVWVPESPILPRGAFYAKHWSENQGLVEQLLKQKLLEPVIATPASSGFIENILAYRLKNCEDQREV